MSAERRYTLDERRVLGTRYWNCGNIGVAIVAVEGYVNDWAAYIGGSDTVQSEGHAIELAAMHGCKLAETEARAHFPNINKMYRP